MKSEVLDLTCLDDSESDDTPVKRRKETHSTSSFFSMKNWSLSNKFNYMTGNPIDKNNPIKKKQKLTKYVIKQTKSYNHYGRRSTLKGNHLKQISKAEVLDLTCLNDSESDDNDITKVSYDLTKPTPRDHAMGSFIFSESSPVVSKDTIKRVSSPNNLIKEAGHLEERNHLKQISKADVLDLTCWDDSESDDIHITKVSYDLTKPTPGDHAMGSVIFSESSPVISKDTIKRVSSPNNLIEETDPLEERNHLKQISKAEVLDLTCLDDSESGDIDITKVSYDLTKPTPRGYAMGSFIFSELSPVISRDSSLNNLMGKTGRLGERNYLNQISKAKVLDLTCLDSSESDDVHITKVTYDLTKPTPRDHAVGSVIFSESSPVVSKDTIKRVSSPNNLIKETGRLEKRNYLMQISKADVHDLTCWDDSESDDIHITKVSYDLTKPTPRDHAMGSVIFSKSSPVISKDTIKRVI